MRGPRYTLILDEVRRQLKLKFIEYSLCDKVYHLMQNPKHFGWCYATRKSLGELIDVSERHALRLIAKMVKQGFIEIDPETKHMRTTEKWYDNVVMVGDKKTPDLTSCHDQLVTPTMTNLSPSHNNVENNTDNNNLTTSQPNENKKIIFDFGSMKFTNISDSLKEKFKAAYPALEINQEIEKAGAWLLANPANKKKNYLRYLINWFSRAQDRAPRVNPEPKAIEPTSNGAQKPNENKTGYINFSDERPFIEYLLKNQATLQGRIDRGEVSLYYQKRRVSRIEDWVSKIPKEVKELLNVCLQEEV